MLQAAWRATDDAIAHAVVQFPVNPVTREVDYSKPSSRTEYGLIIDFLADETITKVFHHANFDLRMLEASGHQNKGRIEDTLFASRCCYSLEESYGLKPLSDKYLKIPTDDESALKKSVIKARNLAKRKYPEYKLGKVLEEDYWLPHHLDSENNLCETYGVGDVIRNIQLWEFYEQGLTELGCWEAYNLEMEFLQIVLEMERRGILFDEDQCLNEISKLWKDIAECKRAFHESIPAAIRPEQPINIGSHIQLLSLLRQCPNLPFLENTTGDLLEKVVGPLAKEGGPLATDYPMLYWVLMLRGYEKGLSTFKSYIEFAIDDPIGCPFQPTKSIHATVNQGNTRSFRLSYNDPNLQQCANPKTSDGFNVVSGRGVFGPRPGYIWYCVDFKQLELRIFASRANEPTLLKVFREGGDPHDATRQKVPFLANKPKEVGRKLAKNTNFSVVNRGGKKVLNEKYGIPLNEGAQIIRELYAEFPDMEARQKWLYEYAKENGYIYNAYNRKLDIPEGIEYTCAPAYDIQGSAADFIKRSIIKAHKVLKTPRPDGTIPDAHIVLQIHDEIVFEIKKEHCFKSFLLEIKTAIEDHDGVFNLPMQSEWAKTSTYWSEKSSKGLEWLNNAN